MMERGTTGNCCVVSNMPVFEVDLRSRRMGVCDRNDRVHARETSGIGKWSREKLARQTSSWQVATTSMIRCFSTGLTVFSCACSTAFVPAQRHQGEDFDG